MCDAEIQELLVSRVNSHLLFPLQPVTTPNFKKIDQLSLLKKKKKQNISTCRFYTLFRQSLGLQKNIRKTKQLRDNNAFPFSADEG